MFLNRWRFSKLVSILFFRQRKKGCFAWYVWSWFRFQVLLDSYPIVVKCVHSTTKRLSSAGCDHFLCLWEEFKEFLELKKWRWLDAVFLEIQAERLSSWCGYISMRKVKAPRGRSISASVFKIHTLTSSKKWAYLTNGGLKGRKHIVNNEHGRTPEGWCAYYSGSLYSVPIRDLTDPLRRFPVGVACINANSTYNESHSGAWTNKDCALWKEHCDFWGKHRQARRIK